MKLLLLVFAGLLTCSSAHAQCGCPPGDQWRLEIKVREATLRDVIAAGNKKAVAAVTKLIIGIGIQALADSLKGHDNDASNCSEMNAAIAAEAKAERKMIEDFANAAKAKAK